MSRTTVVFRDKVAGMVGRAGGGRRGGRAGGGEDRARAAFLPANFGGGFYTIYTQKNHFNARNDRTEPGSTHVTLQPIG